MPAAPEGSPPPSPPARRPAARAPRRPSSSHRYSEIVREKDGTRGAFCHVTPNRSMTKNEQRRIAPFAARPSIFSARLLGGTGSGEGAGGDVVVLVRLGDGVVHVEP